MHEESGDLAGPVLVRAGACWWKGGGILLFSDSFCHLIILFVLQINSRLAFFGV